MQIRSLHVILQYYKKYFNSCDDVMKYNDVLLRDENIILFIEYNWPNVFKIEWVLERF